MSLDRAVIARGVSELEQDAAYTAQAYFESARWQDFWSRGIVFVPALAAAVSSILITIGQSRNWGAVGAVAGAVAATASFLGSSRRAERFLASARAFTVLRHQAQLAQTILSAGGGENEAMAELVRLRAAYDTAVQDGDPVPRWHFSRAQKRISQGVLNYTNAGSPPALPHP
jgi:hypothetical protein